MDNEETTPDEWKENEPDIPDGRKPGEDQDGEEKEVSPEGWNGDEPEEERRARTTGGTHHHTSQEVKEPIPEGGKTREDLDCQEKETSPDGWKRDEPGAVRRACTTGGTLNHTSQEVKKTIQTGRRSKNIPELFRSQEKKSLERDMDRLEKEERLEMKKRLENTWKLKKSHYDHLRWAKELLTEQILEKVLKEGNEPEMIRDEEIRPEGRKGDEPEEVRRARTTGGTFHLTSQVVKETLPEGVKGIEEQKPQDDEKEISTEGWIKSKKFQNKAGKS